RVARDRRLTQGQRGAEVEESGPDPTSALARVVAGDRGPLERHVPPVPGDEDAGPVGAGVVAADLRALDEDGAEGDAVVEVESEAPAVDGCIPGDDRVAHRDVVRQ